MEEEGEVVVEVVEVEEEEETAVLEGGRAILVRPISPLWEGCPILR